MNDELAMVRAERDALARHVEALTRTISNREACAFKKEWEAALTKTGMGDHAAVLVALTGFLNRRQTAGQFAAFS